MICSDTRIQELISAGDLGLDPMPPANTKAWQPVSIDLTLGDQAQRIPPHDDPWNIPTINVSRETHNWESETFDTLTIKPGEFLLVSTAERVKLSPKIAARVEGKSSLARQGLLVHITAGFIDPGFEGHITMEVCNLSPDVMSIAAGTRFCQLVVEEVSGTVAKPYGHLIDSNYSGSTGAVPPKPIKD